MQKDIASKVADSLNIDNKIGEMLSIIKQQATEIQKRGNKIVDLEDKNDMLQKNILVIANSNKQLEYMIENLKSERQKLLEELEDLKKTEPVLVKQTKQKKQKNKQVTTEVSQ